MIRLFITRWHDAIWHRIWPRDLEIWNRAEIWRFLFDKSCQITPGGPTRIYFGWLSPRSWYELRFLGDSSDKNPLNELACLCLQTEFWVGGKYYEMEALCSQPNQNNKANTTIAAEMLFGEYHYLRRQGLDNARLFSMLLLTTLVNIQYFFFSKQNVLNIVAIK